MSDASDLRAGPLPRPRAARRLRVAHAGALALLGFAAVALAGVLLRPALPIDETRYLAVAWEMWARGDWLVPTKNFALYTHKPPLLFWTMNLVWSLTGVSEIAARLVGPGFAVLCLLLTGRLARRLWPDRAEVGASATLALAGMLAFALYGELTMFDAALAAATVGGMLALLRAVHAGRTRNWALLGLALALGGLAKGPVILIHLGPALALSPLWSGGRITWRAMARGAGIAIGTGLGLVALWVVPAAVTGGPDHREAILWTQSAGRVTDAFAHARPWWFLLALLPALLFPWIAVPALLRAGARADWRDPGLRLCLVWGGTGLLLFSLISGKQAHYLIPELPAAALVVARLSPGRFPLRVPALVVAAGALAGIAIAAGLVPLGRAEALLQPRAVPVAACLLALAACLASLRLRGLAGGAVLTLGTVLSLNLLVGLTATRPLYDTHRIAAAIAPFQPAGIAFYGQSYHAEFNFAGRLTAPVATPATAADLAAWQAEHPAGVIVARLDRDHPDWPPHETIPFRNAPYAVWHAADAPRPESSP
ncbi:glycosyltransferase family 39 protein [Paracoccus sp. (in: a-proteobacteria)]|uniref:glycosyltransferase family 39 protein n=1 Tax=Paracoccus sp. TaxID=267 RepID=UPI0026E0B4F9|nr:glycosyltransferase family 39 protein [Paracoccus sp. (in: a-proteobacteria)]MDO5370977.1 glycosyltransferase family 39 protein [Paracoccus sp. (in: a-proteobacteria)]